MQARAARGDEGNDRMVDTVAKRKEVGRMRRSHGGALVAIPPL